ncbi:MAG: YdcF family protein [Alphaproteobacteria bacterium]
MLFALSKIFWTLANPGNLFILSLLVGALGLLTPWRWLRGLARWVLGLSIGAALVISILPVGAWLLAPLEDRFPRLVDPIPRVDGIVLLGGAINLPRTVDRGGIRLNGNAERVTAFVGLAQQYPNAKLVFSGGSGLLLDQVHREADYTSQLLETLGITSSRVIYERDSRNTYENAVNTMAAVKPQPGEVWLLVTSAAHMPRSVGAFRRAGWPVTAYPVSYITGPNDTRGLDLNFAKGLSRTSSAFYEWIGLITYWWLDRIDSVFPGPDPAAQ